MRFHLNPKFFRLHKVLLQRKCRLTVLFLSSLSVVSLFYFYLLQWNIICLNIDIESRMNNLCVEFKQGKAHGSLCEPLCDRGQISVLSCQSMHKGKSAVFTARWNDSTVVIKSHRITSEYIPLVANSSEVFPDYNKLQEMISQSLQMNFGVRQANLSSLYPFIPHHHPSPSQELMVNLWQLSQDNEYVTLMINEHSRFFPNILASCGTFYAVQYAKPISLFDIFSDRHEHFYTRVKLAKMLLELLDGLENTFQNPLHICDVKLEHFGLLGDRLVLLDADTVFPKPVVDRSESDGRSCTRHADCDMFDCRSLCNTLLGVCDTPVVNNNLQLVCQKIFIESGLMVSRHLPTDKRRLLEECARPYSSLRQSASREIHKGLEAFFNEYLRMAS